MRAAALGLMVFLSLKAMGQQMHFSSLSVNEGLSQSSVYCIFQDSKGFMWLGTGDGLNRYDGRAFRVFKHKHADPFSLSNNSVRKIMEDTLHHLWIGTDNGLNEYVPEQKKFITYRLKDIAAIMPFAAHAGKVWFWANGFGAGYVEPGERRTHLLFKAGAYSGTAFNDACYDSSSGRFLVATTNGLWIIDPVSGAVTQRFPGILCSAILRSSQKMIWLCLENRVVVLTENLDVRKTFAFTKGSIPFEHLYSLGEDRYGRIWLGSYGKGIFVLNQLWGGFEHVGQLIQNGVDLVKTIFRDRAGNMWVGTDGNGVRLWSPYRQKFMHCSTASMLKPSSLSSNFIKCFGELPDHRIMIGTHERGANIFDPERGTNMVTSRFGHTVSRIEGDRNGGYWVIADGTVTRYDQHLAARERIRFDNPSPYFYPICVYTDRSNNTWFGSSRGLYKRGAGQMRCYFRDSSIVYAIAEDSSGDVWIATGSGVLILEKGNVRASRKVRLDHPEHPEMFVHCLAPYAGHMWMAGARGLISYRFSDGMVKYYGMDDGLPDAMLYGIVPDSGHLWISSNRGLTRFDIAAGWFRNYDVADGLQSYEFNSGAFGKASDGTIYFGGINGFNRFRPRELEENEVPPGTSITSIRLFDQPMETGADEANMNLLELQHNQNILSFEFASLDFTDPMRNCYSYRMEGIDTGWVYSYTKNFARYANLVPGSYVFTMRSCNSDGAWGSASKLFITISAPWWRQWWFVAFYVTAAVAAAYVSLRTYLRFRMMAQQRVIERQLAVQEERARISKDMHDDLGSGLTQIAIMTELLKARVADAVQLEHVEKISRTANDLVDNMGQIIWSMNPQNDAIENVMGYLRKFALDFFENTGIACNIHFPHAIEELRLSQYSRRNVFLTIKEVFHNILKHSGATEVNVTLSAGGGELQITIADNGKGFDLVQNRRSGNGISNMEKRLRDIGGTFFITPGSEGTVCTLKLPV